MFSEYRNQCKKENKSVSKEWLYREIFERMGLSFKKPRGDTCKKCDIYFINKTYENNS